LSLFHIFIKVALKLFIVLQLFIITGYRSRQSDVTSL